MTAVSVFTTIGTYLFGGISISGLIWADTIATWPGRLWVICIVAACLCTIARLLQRNQHHELLAFQLGLEVAAFPTSAGAQTPPAQRHLRVVTGVTSETQV